MKQNYSQLASLVKQIKSGDSQAFSKMYGLTYQKLYFLCFSILRNEEDAQDALQETYIKIHQNIHSLENEKVFVAWINKIAYNTCIRILNLNKKKVDLPGDEFLQAIPADSNLSNPEEKVMEASKKEIISDMIDRLDPVLRTALILKYFEGLKVTQIASIMDCPVGTVNSRLNTARRQLKEALSKERSKGHLSRVLTLFAIKGALAICAQKSPLKVHAADAVFDKVVAETTLPEGLSFVPQAMALPTQAIPPLIIRGGTTAACAAALTTSALMLAPPSFTNVHVHIPETTYTNNPVVVTATVEAPLNSIKQVYAVSADSNNVIYGTMKDDDTAYFEIQENGNYTLYAVNSNDETASIEAVVSCIDKEGISIKSYACIDDILNIYIEDNLSGVDYTSVYGEMTDGTKLYPIQTDEAAGSLVFAYPESNFTLYVSDKAGNESAFLIEPYTD